MEKQTVQQRLKQIMSERNLRQVDIINMSKPYQEELGIKMPKSYLSNYINNYSSPDSLRLTLLSKTLGVTETWLMGYDVPKNQSEFEKLQKDLDEHKDKVHEIMSNDSILIGESVLSWIYGDYFDIDELPDDIVDEAFKLSKNDKEEIGKLLLYYLTLSSEKRENLIKYAYFLNKE